VRPRAQSEPKRAAEDAAKAAADVLAVFEGEAERRKVEAGRVAGSKGGRGRPGKGSAPMGADPKPKRAAEDAAKAAADVLAVFEGEAKKRQGTRTDLVMTSSDGRLIKGTSSIGKARLLRPRAQKSAKRAAEDAAKAAADARRV
jgi:hypothetical protein